MPSLGVGRAHRTNQSVVHRGTRLRFSAFPAPRPVALEAVTVDSLTLKAADFRSNLVGGLPQLLRPRVPFPSVTPDEDHEKALLRQQLQSLQSQLTSAQKENEMVNKLLKEKGSLLQAALCKLDAAEGKLYVPGERASMDNPPSQPSSSAARPEVVERDMPCPSASMSSHDAAASTSDGQVAGELAALRAVLVQVEMRRLRSEQVLSMQLAEVQEQVQASQGAAPHGGGKAVAGGAPSPPENKGSVGTLGAGGLLGFLGGLLLRLLSMLLTFWQDVAQSITDVLTTSAMSGA